MPVPRFEAVLIAGATETAYTRAGSGRPVLMLFSDRRVAPVILEALATHARVLQPVLPDAVFARRGRPFRAWLRDFMDGLGVDRATLVADSPLAAATLGFAVREPDRVDALALLRRRSTLLSRRLQALVAGLEGQACALRVIALDPSETAERSASLVVESLRALLGDLETRRGG